MKKLLPFLLCCTWLACSGSDDATPAPAGGSEERTSTAQEWLSEPANGCRVALKLDQGTFIFAKFCSREDGGRNAMSSQGSYAKRTEDTLTLTHSVSSCPDTFNPGTETTLRYEKPQLLAPIGEETVRLSYREPIDAKSSETAAQVEVQLGCFSADGTFSVPASQTTN